jgi:hypothetical protein
LQGLSAARTREQSRGFAVDQNGHTWIAPKAQIAVWVDLDCGNISQHVGERAGPFLQVVGDAVAPSIDRGAVAGRRRDDDDPWLRLVWGA